jgi:hypothetical protein
MPSWSALFNGIHGENYVIPFNYDSVNRQISRTFYKTKTGNRLYRELLDTLIGAEAGGAAADSYVRAKAVNDHNQLGGNREMETISVIARNSTAADVTMLKALIGEVRQNSFVSSVDGSSPRGVVNSLI